MSFNRSLISSTFWSFSGQLAYVVILLFSNILLARILGPKEFGRMGIIMFFISLANVISETGLSGALVRKKSVTKQDYSTVFVFNLILSITCFSLIFFTSGVIANYYNDDYLRELIMASSVIVLINAFTVTQNTKLIIDLDFKKKSLFKLIGVVFGVITGIAMAYNGFGVWSLVFLQIVSTSINVLLLLLNGGWFFSLSFDFKIFKELFSFGANTTASNILIVSFDNIYQLLLAKYFSITQVGYFYQGKKIQDVPLNIINLTMQSAIYSSLSKLDDVKQMNKAYFKIGVYLNVISAIIFSVFFVFSKEIVLLVLGNEWYKSIFFIKILSVASFFFLGEMYCRVFFKILNKTNIILRLEIIKKTIQMVSIFVGIYYLKLEYFMYGLIFTNIISYILNLWIINKYSIASNVKNFLIKIVGVILVVVTTILVTNIIKSYIHNEFILLAIIPLFVIIMVLQFIKFKIIKIDDIKNLKKN